MPAVEVSDAIAAGKLHRRDILLSGLATGAALTLPTGSASAQTGRQTSLPETLPPTARRKLGTLEVSSIGLGCQWNRGTSPDTVSDFYGSRIDRKTAVGLIRAAVDQGVTLIDTAEAYGPFVSEEIVGEALQGLRHKVVLESKFGWNIDPQTGQRLPGLNSRPEHIKVAIDGMLRRLKTDRIDMVYQHRVDPKVPIEDVAGAIKGLMAAGKVRHYGLSESGVQTVRRAHAIQPLTAVQNEYSMLWRGPEAQIVPLCEELGIGLVCWSPMGMGFLSGSITPDTRFSQGDFRASVPCLTPQALQANMALVEVVKKWAKQKNVLPAQIALAWLLAQKPWIVPIPGTTKIAHLKEDLGAAAIRFTPAELREINADVAAVKIEGDVLPAGVRALSGVEAPPKTQDAL